MANVAQGGKLNVGPVRTSRVVGVRGSIFAPPRVSDGGSSAWPSPSPNMKTDDAGGASLLARILNAGADNESSVAPPSSSPGSALVRALTQGFGGAQKNGTNSSYKFGPDVKRSTTISGMSDDGTTSGISMPTSQPGQPARRAIDVLMLKLGLSPGPQKQADYEVNSQMAGRSQVPTAEDESPDTLTGAGASLIGNRGSNV